MWGLGFQSNFQLIASCGRQSTRNRQRREGRASWQRPNGGSQMGAHKRATLFNLVGACLATGDRRLKNYQYSTERQKRNQYLAPVLAIISGNSLVFSRKNFTSTGFYRRCAPDASARVLVTKNQSPTGSLRQEAMVSQ